MVGRPRCGETAGLPPGMRYDPVTKRYYYRDTRPFVGGIKRHFPLGPDRDVAIAKCTVLRAQLIASLEINGSAPHKLKGCRSKVSETAAIFSSAKNNARARGILFEITMDDVESMFARAGGRCEVTGLVFNWNKRPGMRRRPFIPSLDRMDSSAGYTVENCRIVCAAVNMAINEFGDSVFRQMALGYVKKNETGGLSNFTNISPEEANGALIPA